MKQIDLTQTKLAFIGLGIMGSNMARHMLNKHGKLNVYNRSQNKLDAWLQQNPSAKKFNDLQDLANHSTIIFLCIGNDSSVRDTVHHLLSAGKPLIIVDHTTTSPKLALEMAELCANHNSCFLDCPVSGGQIGAQNATLTMMCSGEETIFNQVQPYLNYTSNYQHYFGASGNGQTAKMINQILIANILQGLSEGLTLAKHANLDINGLVNTLKRGAAGSWQLENRAKTMLTNEFNFGFAIDLMIKDLNLIVDYMNSHHLPLQNIAQTQTIINTYKQLSEQGFGQCDTSALIKQFDV